MKRLHLAEVGFAVVLSIMAAGFVGLALGVIYVGAWIAGQLP